MYYKHLFHRFWHTIWFVLLPLLVAWLTVATLDRRGVIEEVEIWYVLLLFLGLAMTMYSLRHKLPYWQDTDPNSEYNKKIRRKDAAFFARNAQKLLRKHQAKLGERSLHELEQSIQTLKKAIDEKKDDAVRSAQKKLNDKIERHMAFARKGARREYFESIFIAVLVAVVLRFFVVEAFKIPSESMVPTLMVGDHIFVSKYRYGLSVPLSNKRLVRFAQPAHGEVVVFIKPPPPGLPVLGADRGMTGKDFIKRIIGLPGDEILVRNDIVSVNGKEIPRCKIGEQTFRTQDFFGQWSDHESDLWIEKHGEFTYKVIEERFGRQSNYGPVHVPDDKVFVMGDNRDNSSDSRDWGFVPIDNIKGRAMFIWWSNRRPHGFQWDRVGNVIMSQPEIDPDQQGAFNSCPNLR